MKEVSFYNLHTEKYFFLLFILSLFLYVCYVSDDDGTYHHKKSKKLDYIRHISLWPKLIRIFHILGPLATSHLSINIVRKLLAIIR